MEKLKGSGPKERRSAKSSYALRSWMGRDVPGLDFGKQRCKVITSLALSFSASQVKAFLVGLFAEASQASSIERCKHGIQAIIRSLLPVQNMYV